jgi:hypothetical protein
MWTKLRRPDHPGTMGAHTRSSPVGQVWAMIPTVCWAIDLDHDAVTATIHPLRPTTRNSPRPRGPSVNGSCWRTSQRTCRGGASGRVDLYTEREPCTDCQNVIS